MPIEINITEIPREVLYSDACQHFKEQKEDGEERLVLDDLGTS